MKNKIIQLWLKNQLQLFSLGSSLVRASSRFLLILLASRFLPPSSFGILNIFIAIYFFTRIVTDGSLHMPYVKLAAEEGKDKALINTHIAVFKFLYIGVLSLILFAGAGSLTEFTGLSEKKLLYLLPGLLLSFGFYSFFCQHLNAALRMADLFVLESIQFIVTLCVLGYYFFLGQLGQVESYIMVFIVTYTLSGIVAMFFHGKGIDFKCVYNHELAVLILYYSRYSIILAMGAMLFLRSDVIMLGHFLAPAQVAVYGIALIVSEIINVILDAIQKVCLPMASLLDSQGSNDRILSLFKSSLRTSYLMSVPIVSVAVAASSFLLDFFYKGLYDDAFWVIFLLAISALIKPAGYIGGAILLGTGYVKVDSRNCWLTAIMNIVLNLFFIPIWGVIGAAITTIISYIVLSLLQYKAMKRLFASP